MSIHRTLLLLLLASGMAAQPLAAQSILGRVVDGASGDSVSAATVTAVAESGRAAAHASTSASGAFALTLRSAGVYSLRVERTGYQTVTSSTLTVSPSESVQVTLRISPSAVPLEPLTVVGRRGPQRNPALEPTGFYEREARTSGRFYRRDFIEKRMNRPLINILDEIPGISIRRDPRNVDQITFERGQITGAIYRSQKGITNLCYPVLYLDGVRVALGDRLTTVNDLVAPERIEALEVYASAAQLPVQFSGSDSACGVIVIWTRRNS